jgi:type VI secretion system protein VasG
MAHINLKALVQKLNPHCQRNLEAAAGMCLSNSHYNVEIEHYLLKLLDHSQNDIALILAHYNVDSSRLTRDILQQLNTLKTGNANAPALSQRLIDWLREGLVVATLEYPQQTIRSSHLLYALLSEDNLQRILTGLSREFAKIPPALLQQELLTIIANSLENEEGIVKNFSEAMPHTTSNSKTPSLEQFTINLTELARAGKIDPVIGREEEIRQVIDILMRRRQNNPILTGEAGVGKTAVVEGFALRVAKGEVPPALQKVAVHTLDMGLLQAGAGIKGEFENRLKSVINEVKTVIHPIILFIDEAHTLVGAGAQAGQGDAANLLKPALARGELRTIAATTWGEYKKYFEQDAALARRFHVVKVEEPSEEIAIHMLRGLVQSLEQHHQVRILDEAVISAVRLSMRYLANRQLPDKAISVLDTACARLAIRETTTAPTMENYARHIAQIEVEITILKRETVIQSTHKNRLANLLLQRDSYQNKLIILQKRWQQEKHLIDEIRRVRLELEEYHHEQEKNAAKIINKTAQTLQKKLQKLSAQLTKLQAETPLLQDCVDEQAIAEVIASWTGIPLGRMVSSDKQTLTALETNLQKRVVGQEHALKIIAQNIRVSRAQLADPCKPMGIFLLVGPSGVGKTETAFSLAELLYGGEQNMTVINLSEFKEEHKVSLLLGSPPGYVGYGEGGILTEAIRRRPYSLVLLDEVEKAHPGVHDIFYQVFDKGTLKDGQGRDINFKNTVIILTSNAGSELISKLCADPDTMPDIEGLTQAIWPELTKLFKPAFLGRVTLIPYLSLDNNLIAAIIKLQLKRIQNRIYQYYQAELTYTAELVSYITQKCQQVQTGARNIDYLLTQRLLPELAGHFLNMLGENKKISKAHVTINEQNDFVYAFE